MNQKRFLRKVLSLGMISCLLLAGCRQNQTKDTHEPISILSAGINYSEFQKKLKEKYPEINLQIISYTGSNSTGYAQYLFKNHDIPYIYTVSVFGMQDIQSENLIDLSGYDFLNNYKTADIKQVTIDGSVYMVPAASTIIGMYYNQTMFEKNGWKVPQNFTELKDLAKTIQAKGIDPCSAQFELPGNGFFDLLTMAKTNYLSTSEGLQWERDFQAGKITAKEGLSEAMKTIQELIDCGMLDAQDARQSSEDGLKKFKNGQSAFFLNAGTLIKFSQNDDGTGDKYGIMPFYGRGEDSSVLINKPMAYFGLSKELEKNEQKKADAIKIMEFLATSEGQNALISKQQSYVTPLKGDEIDKNSPFYEVQEYIRNGHTSTLAYAGYEGIIIDVGRKVQDWVAGNCQGEDVLAYMDQVQKQNLGGDTESITVANDNFTIEQTTQLLAHILKEATKSDIGMLSVGGYHDNMENTTGVCAKVFKGNITLDILNTWIPAEYGEAVCILTLSGKDLQTLLESGLIVKTGVQGFDYIPAGIKVRKNEDGKIQQITLDDGSLLDENKKYTIAIDKGAYTNEIAKKGQVQETDLLVSEVVTEYLKKQTSISPLESSIS